MGGVLSQPKSYPDEASLIAADYMSFTGAVENPGDNSLTLTMERKMARVVVEIVKFNDQYAEGTKVNSVTINGDVKAYKQSDNTYYALMVPCEAQTDQEFLSLEVADNNAKETLTGIPALEAGKSYTYQLTVGKNKISVSGISVADWNTGTITDNGKAEQIIRYVTFTADGPQKFRMVTPFINLIDGFEYSVKDGKWTPVVANTEVTFGGDNGDLRLRGTNLSGTAKDKLEHSIIQFTNRSVNVACTGDIRTLLNWRNYNTVDTKDARFCGLFYNCSVLTSAPELPATVLAESCYAGMFSGCVKLSSVTMLAPSDQITSVSDCCKDWLKDAGPDPVLGGSLLLKIKNNEVLKALNGKSYLPDNWQIAQIEYVDDVE